MRTAVTVINTIQTGADSYKDLKITKIFEDEVTLGDIKSWANRILKYKGDTEDISLGSLDFSDVID